MGKGAGIPKNVKFLGLTSLFNDIASDIIAPVLPIFLTSVLNATTALVGLIEGLAESTASILKLFSGLLSDRLKSRKGLVVAGYAVSTFVRPLLSVVTTGWQVLFLRFFDRIGKGIRTSPRDALLALSTPAEIRGKAFGFHRAMDHLGAAIGSIFAFLFLEFIARDGAGMRMLFFVASLFGVFALLSLVAGVKEVTAQSVPHPGGERTEQTNIFKGGSELLKIADYRNFLIAVALFALGNSSDAFIILKAQELGIPLSHIPLIWFGFHLIKTLSSTPGGTLSDRVGRRAAITTGWILYSASYFGFAFSTAPLHLLIVLFFYGIYYGLVEGAEKALIADLVPAIKGGTAFGIYHFVVGAATFPSSLLTGVIWHNFGSLYAFATGAILSLAAALILFLFCNGRVKPV